MIEVPASAVNARDHVGRIDQSGYEIVWVDDVPMYPDGASVKVVHTETGIEQVWDLSADCTLWLRDADPIAQYRKEATGDLTVIVGMPHLEGWTRVALQVADEVTSA